MRSWRAAQAGKTTDNCPHFADQVVKAWELPFRYFDPEKATAAELATALRELVERAGAGVILWGE